MTDAYDLRRLRRLLLLLPAAARASRAGRGVPLAEAVRLTGARSTRQVVEDVDALGALYLDPGGGDVLVDLALEDGEIQAVYAVRGERLAFVRWRERDL